MSVAEPNGAPGGQTDDLVGPASADEPLFDELDAHHRTVGRSCCTLWTLGLFLAGILGVSLWLILAL